MATGDMEIGLVVSAQNQAKAELDDLQRRLVDVGKVTEEVGGRSERSVQRFDTSLRRASAGVRVLAYPLVAELSPALGTTTSRLASVLAGAAVMPGAFAAIGTAALGLAGVVGGTLLTSWLKLRKETEETNRALQSFDVGRITQRLTDLGKKAEEAAEQVRKARGFQESIDPRREQQLIGPLSPAARARRARDEAAAIAEETRRARQAREQAEGFRMMEDPAAAPMPPLLAAALVEQAEREAFFARAINRLQGEEAVPFNLLVEPSAARSAEITARREAAEATAIARHADEERVTFDLLQPQGLHERLGAEASMRDLSRERLLIEQERLGILGAMPGLSIREREAMEAALGVERERVTLEQIRAETARRIADVQAQGLAGVLTTDQAKAQEEEIARLGQMAEANVQLAGAMERVARARAQFEREDLTGGLLAGIRSIEEEIGGVGTSMQRIFTDSARASYQALSDQLLLPFERDLRKLPGFVQTILRTTLDELTKQLVLKPLLGNLQQLLQPGGAGAFPLGSGADVTGASPATLVALTQQGYALTGGAGGQTYAVPTALTRQQQQVALLRSQPMVAGDPAFAGATYEADLFGYGALGAGVVRPSEGSFWYTPSYARQGPQGGYIAGPTYGQVASNAAQGAGAALAAYGLYQGTAQGYNTSYLAGVGTGAVTGALYGTSISPGVGTVVGLVAGALVGFFGANASQAKYAKQHRRAQRNRDAARIAEGIAAAMAEAETVSIQDVLQRRLVSGNTVGGVLLGLARHMGDAELLDFLLDYGASFEGFTYERLGSIGELAAYLTPQGVRALLDAALAMFRREADLERQIIVGQEEVVTWGGQRATVQTLLPLSRRSELRPGFETFLFQGQGVSDAELERFLFRLVAIDDRRGIKVFRQDEGGGTVLSRTVMAR